MAKIWKRENDDVVCMSPFFLVLLLFVHIYYFKDFSKSTGSTLLDLTLRPPIGHLFTIQRIYPHGVFRYSIATQKHIGPVAINSSSFASFHVSFITSSNVSGAWKWTQSHLYARNECHYYKFCRYLCVTVQGPFVFLTTSQLRFLMNNKVHSSSVGH